MEPRTWEVTAIYLNKGGFMVHTVNELFQPLPGDRSWRQRGHSIGEIVNFEGKLQLDKNLIGEVFEGH